VGRSSSASPAVVDLEGADAPWPFREVAETGNAVEVVGLTDKFGPLPGGTWPESPQRAVALPMAKPGQTRLAGFVVAGVSPRLVVNDEYKGFFDLLAGHVAAAIANARAYEEEKRRAEALAELDRVKTAFFSNVSHEFRTPLTLMLGPVADLLSKNHTDLSPAVVSQLEVVNRNGLRLLRLVNSLLDFSRIEAGRARAVYEPTDLAGYTGELASVFRSACERARLRLAVDCPKLSEPVLVDREMWEKIVLNLLSNAFKFTFEGEISVSLRQSGRSAELRIKDSGTGIAPQEMPRLFERFHRVENARGRTHEGSGIGLALVQELARLHGGSVTAESVLGEGTTFTVSVPLGSAHIPSDQIEEKGGLPPTAKGAGPFVEEALRWLPDEVATRNDACEELPTRYESMPVAYPESAHEDGDGRPCVLVADDNADMRQYIVRLLAERHEVEAVADGEAALAAVHKRLPDLILTDVMMPRLDGFGLLCALRTDPETRDLPVIMLSARAGEECRVEGMQAGAGDYLVKPFSARELLARVSAHLHMARLRREASESLRGSEERLRTLIRSSPIATLVIDSDANVRLWNHAAARLFGWTEDEVVGQRVPFIPEGKTIEAVSCRDTALRGDVFNIETQRLKRDGSLVDVSLTAAPLRDGRGRISEILVLFEDITRRKQSEAALREREAALNEAQRVAHLGSWEWDAATDRNIVSDELCRIYGLPVGQPIPAFKDQDGRMYPMKAGCGSATPSSNHCARAPAMRWTLRPCGMASRSGYPPEAKPFATQRVASSAFAVRCRRLPSASAPTKPSNRSTRS
jgi:PAS domain S-box-containing protein